MQPHDIIDLTAADSGQDDGDSAVEPAAQQLQPQQPQQPPRGGRGSGSAAEPSSSHARRNPRHRRLQMIKDFFRERAIATGLHADSTHYGTEQLATAIAAASSSSSSTVLCNRSTLLFNTTMADRGWACGYRNCQMLISSVMQSVHGSSLGALLVPPRMPAERVPPVRELQEMLELSWRDGFDCDGADQLDHRVMGTRKWIGTTEIYCILAHLGVRAHIVDFHCPTAPDRSHPALFSWIIEYFTAAPPPALLAGDQADDSLAGEAAGSGGAVRFAARHPLYLQHQGHSRTVVGVELADDATYLLVFDPDVNAAANPARFRMPIARTRGTRQFQILYVDHADCCPPAVPKQIVSRRIP